MVVAAVRDAYLNHASRMVHGYYELRGGRLHFEIMVEDALNHRAVKTAAEDGTPAGALNRIARLLAPAAHSFTAPEPAVAAWGRGDFEQAVMLDPSFSQAWVNWAQQLASMGDKARAVDVAKRGLMQPKLDSPIDQARLQLVIATLSQDNAQRLEASRTLARLIPYDPSVLASVAELDMSMRNFAAAVEEYQRARRANPSDPSVLNLLGYAQALAGDVEGARKTLTEYGQISAAESVNAFDSLGEALFINGKFEEAQREFEQAYRKDPKFLDGETLWKAAHARWLASPQNTAPADRVAQQYFETRAAAHDPLLDWRRATWLYETGRRGEAVELLTRTAASNSPEAALAKTQLEFWNSAQPFTTDLDKLKEAYFRSDPVNDGLPRTLYAAALLRAGNQQEAGKLLERWPLPPRDDSTLSSLLYPEFLQLRQQLGLTNPSNSKPVN